jgi:hypothetical protein
MSSGYIHQIIVIAAAVGSALGQSAGTFTATGSMTTARAGHTATLLADGRVLIAGGSQEASAEIYDPATGIFSPTGSMSTPRWQHTSTLLPDGRVLMAGGGNGAGPLASIDIYDPGRGVFSPAGNLLFPRGGHSAILLANGTVLLVGGYGLAAWPVLAPAEVYDPATGVSTPAGPYVGVSGCDFCDPSTVLADGRVLFPQQAPAQLYDPASNLFSITGTMLDDRDAAAPLLNGNVLFAGGEDDFGRKSTAELYDAAAGAFSSTGSMLSSRAWHTLTLLPDGGVLAAGGETEACLGPICYFGGTVASAELYDPVSGTFTATGSMTTAREIHTATLLNDGKVLVAGGESYGGIGASPQVTANAELYTPLALIPAPRLSPLSGDGQGAIWHSASGQLASSAAPAITGETLSMYTAALSEGGLIPPQVFIGGRSAKVLYFGDAPGYPGFNQVNVRVPDGIVPGSQVSVRLSYLARSSNQVTIAIQ